MRALYVISGFAISAGDHAAQHRPQSQAGEDDPERPQRSNCLPPARLGVVVLLGIGVIHPTFQVAVLFAVGLLVVDARPLRIVARMFDRERLVTGAKAARS